MKVNFSTTELDLGLFDRDNGAGAGRATLIKADLLDE